MPMLPLIQPATLNDVPAMCELLVELFSIENDFPVHPDRQSMGLRMLIADRARGRVLVARAVQGGPILGMVSGQLIYSSAAGGYSALIEDLVVTAGSRGKGLGTSLLEGIMSWARHHGALRIQLLASMSNEPALAYYRRQGWLATQMQSWHYGQ